MSNINQNDDDEAASQGGLIFPTERSIHRDQENLDLLKPKEEKIDRKERYAGLLAGGLFVLFAIEIAVYVYAGFVIQDMENINSVFQVVFPVTAGFLGSAVTYYHNVKVR